MAESSDRSAPLTGRVDGGLDLSFLDRGRTARQELARRRTRAGFVVSVVVTAIWLVAVTATGSWGRVGQHLVAAVTMIFGSFVAGATPQGGGAVAFPIFTKALDVRAEVARSFSLCIQAVGMTSASIAILVDRRPVVWPAVRLGAPAGILAFVATLFLAGDRSRPFWPSTLPGPYVKVTFTLVVAAMAWVVLLGLRIPIRRVADGLPAMGKRLGVAVVLAGALGGVASALVGSGADVFIYLFVVVLFGIRAGIGVPTSVISMAIISIAGFLILGLADGQLRIDLNQADQVVAAGGERLASALPMRQADLFGMWLAAVPVVAWGAPLGALVASRLSPRALVTLALSIAAAEVISTIIFLEPLRTDRALLAYSLTGLAVAVGGISLLAAHRQRLFALPGLAPTTRLTRASVEVARDYHQEL